MATEVTAAANVLLEALRHEATGGTVMTLPDKDDAKALKNLLSFLARHASIHLSAGHVVIVKEAADVC